jgi:predicted aminopeptidase
MLALLLLGACSPLYVIRAGYEEAKILAARESIAELVGDSATPPATRDKLRLVLEARTFAENTLNLDVGDSYTTFSQVDSDTLALVLSGAHRDRFEPYTWWFPIVGRVPYKGYFSEEQAKEAQAGLIRKGFDAYIRPTAAFSTLGWFNDPLVSTLLRYDSVSLANTVIHELLHNSIYLSGEAFFNESFAQFVGGRGAIDFFCGRYGAGSDLCARATAAWQDELVFGEFLSGVVADLEALYGRTDITSDDKIRLREPIFERARQTFLTDVQPRFRRLSFGSFIDQPINNATLISRRLYYHRLDLFERVYHATGGDLPRVISSIIAAAESADDPYTAVERLLDNGESASRDR